MAALGVHDGEGFEWFEPPAAPALQAAHDLLRRLGALDGQARLTDTGQQMIRFPVHPRLGRLIVEGERRGVGEEAAALAALVAEGDISDTARTRFGSQGAGAGAAEGADLLERLDRFQQARAARFSRDRLRGLGVDARAAEAAEMSRRQFAAALRRNGLVKRPTDPNAIDEILAMATLAAFPDRVMRRRTLGSSEALLASGGVADIGAQPPDDLLCAVDVEERIGAAARRDGRAVSVRLAVGIRPEWLLDIAPGELTERDELQWNADRQRVERVSRLLCGAITLEESRQPAPPSAEATRLLSEAALANGQGGPQHGEAPAARHAVRAEHLQGSRAAHVAFIGTQPPCGSGDQRSRQLLAATLRADSPRAVPPLPAPPLARGRRHCDAAATDWERAAPTAQVSESNVGSEAQARPDNPNPAAQNSTGRNRPAQERGGEGRSRNGG